MILTGVASVSHLEHSISDWLEVVTAQPISYDAASSVRILTSLDLLSRNSDRSLNVVPLDRGLKLLPPTGTGSALEGFLGQRSMSTIEGREGFEVERSISEQHEDEYTLADKIRRTIGWL